MGQKIQIRRGNDSERTGIVLDLGEPGWSIDTQKFYIGDGLTTGGINIGMNTGYVGLPTSGASYYVVPVTNSSQQNGINLLNTYAMAASMTPYNNSIGSGNQYTIFLPPGIYDLQSNILILSGNVNIAGISNIAKDTVIKGNATGLYACSVITIRNNFSYNLSDFSVLAASTSVNTGEGTTCILISGGTNYTNFNNIILTVSGNSTIINYAYPTTMAFNNSPGTINNCNFNKVISYGSFLSSGGIAVIAGGINSNVSFTNCEFYGDYNFATLTCKNTFINNCIFVGNSGFMSTSKNSSSWNNSIIRNSYLSGNDFFAATLSSNTKGFQGYIKDTYILGTIKNFPGTMENVYINSSYSNDYPINLQGISTLYPKFNKCTIISPSTIPVSVTGGNNMSGCFTFCKLNTILYTGITGASGNLSAYNIIDPTTN